MPRQARHSRKNAGSKKMPCTLQGSIEGLLGEILDRHFPPVALLQYPAKRTGAIFTQRKRNNRTNNHAEDAAKQHAPEKESIAQKCHR